MKVTTVGQRRPGKKPQPPSSREYLERIVEKAQRKRGFPIRRSFVQRGTPQKPSPGPLAEFITKKDPRALDLYLLLLTTATAEPYAVVFPAETWARALDIKHFGVVSRAWSRLETRKLVRRERAGNRARLTLLVEDGSGRPYTHPFKGTKSDPYGQLPIEYWLEGYYARLDLTAKAMLLVAATWRGSLPLPAERAPSWYGISADTCERGMATLINEGVITKTKDWTPTLYAPGGYVATNVYTLQGPFARPVRQPKVVALPRVGGSRVPF
jgi:hypothetical protein